MNKNNDGPTKAVLQIRPKGDFWSLESSLQSEIKLDDQALRQARKNFSTSWAQHNNAKIVTFDKKLAKMAG